jgi:hypothetical protein
MSAHSFDQLIVNMGVDHSIKLSEKVEDFIVSVASSSENIGLKQAIKDAFSSGDYVISNDIAVVLESLGDQPADQNGVIAALVTMPGEQLGDVFKNNLNVGKYAVKDDIDSFVENLPTTSSTKKRITREIRQIADLSISFGFRHAVFSVLEERGPVFSIARVAIKELPETPASVQDVLNFLAEFQNRTGKAIDSLFTDNNVKATVGEEVYDKHVADIGLAPEVAKELFFRVLKKLPDVGLREALKEVLPRPAWTLERHWTGSASIARFPPSWS